MCKTIKWVTGLGFYVQWQSGKRIEDFFYGMVSVHLTLQSTLLMDGMNAGNIRSAAMPENDSFISRELQESSDQTEFCVSFSLTPTCLLNQNSSVLNVSSIQKSMCCV